MSDKQLHGEKRREEKKRAVCLERGNPSYQFHPALVHMSGVGSETPPTAFKAHERSPADHSQSDTVCSRQALPAFSPLQWLSHSVSKKKPLSESHTLWLTLWSVTFYILVKVWKALHTNECTKWWFGWRTGWSFDIINYKAITVVSSYWKVCFQDHSKKKVCDSYSFNCYNIRFYDITRPFIPDTSCLFTSSSAYNDGSLPYHTVRNL